jgi:hypothetical protein
MHAQSVEVLLFLVIFISFFGALLELAGSDVEPVDKDPDVVGKLD